MILENHTNMGSSTQQMPSGAHPAPATGLGARGCHARAGAPTGSRSPGSQEGGERWRQKEFPEEVELGQGWRASP